MHVHFLDPYRPRPSLIHALDPRVKLVLALAMILAVALTPAGAWPAYILLFALVFSVGMVSELGIGFLLRRSALALPFILAAVPMLFTAKGAPLLAFPLGPGMLTVTVEGVQRLVSILLKSWLSVQIAIVLAASTPFPQLLIAMRAVGLPRLIVAIFGLMWRYLFVLVDEMLRLLRARAARSGDPGSPGVRVGGTLGWRARVTGGMAGNLLVRSFDRGERIYAAMAARGYDGEVRNFPLPAIPIVQRFVLAFGLVLLLSLVLLGYLV